MDGHTQLARGGKAAIEAIATIRDEAAGLPSPPSIGRPPVNVCPDCETPIGAAPWECRACGWTPARGQGGKRTCCMSLAAVIESEDGTYKTAIDEDMADEIKTAKSKKDKLSKREAALAEATVVVVKPPPVKVHRNCTTCRYEKTPAEKPPCAKCGGKGEADELEPVEYPLWEAKKAKDEDVKKERRRD